MIVIARIHPARCTFERDFAAFYSRSQSEHAHRPPRRPAPPGFV